MSRDILFAAASVLTSHIALGEPGQKDAPTPRPDPARFAEDIAAFEKRDAASPPPAGALLFVGSSSIRLWDLAASWPDQPTVNNGFGGSTLSDAIHYFDRLIAPYDPAALVLYAGDNDVNHGLRPEEVHGDFLTLARRTSREKEGVPIVFVAIKPSLKRWDLWPDMKKANDLIEQSCEAHPDWYFADIATPMLDDSGRPDATLLAEDLLHLSPAGYARWTAVVDRILEDALARKDAP